MWRFILGLVFLVSAIHAPGAGATPRFLIDEASVIDAATERRLEQELRTRARNTGATMVVHVARSLEGKSPEEAAQGLFEKLRPGRRGDDRGALLLIAPAERAVRLHVGYGLEGQLNDGKVGALLSTAVIPALRSGDLAGAIGKGIEAVYAELGPGSPSRPERKAPSPGQIAAVSLIFLLAFGLAAAIGGVDGLLILLHMASVPGWRAPEDDRDDDAFAGGDSGGGGASREW